MTARSCNRIHRHGAERITHVAMPDIDLLFSGWPQYGYLLNAHNFLESVFFLGWPADLDDTIFKINIAFSDS